MAAFHQPAENTEFYTSNSLDGCLLNVIHIFHYLVLERYSLRATQKYYTCYGTKSNLNVQVFFFISVGCIRWAVGGSARCQASYRPGLVD